MHTSGDDGTEDALRDRARAVLEASWVEGFDYAAPNTTVYPWMWLWDSCFHALIWGALGSPKGRAELRSVLSVQADDGFVPHMGYQMDPPAALELWKQPGRSFITQPPMFCHALRLLREWGFSVDDLVPRARAGVNFLLRRRRDHTSGLVRVVHPWEAGTDDSPRWDHWAGSPFDRPSWKKVKVALLETVSCSEFGSGLANPAFCVAPAGFNALVAFNMRELATVIDDGQLEVDAGQLAEALDRQWDPDRGTWADLSVPSTACSDIRTLEALLPVLITPDEAKVERVFHDLFDESAFGFPYGPSGLHGAEAAFDPDAYWRGPAWPQLTYLFFVAAVRRGRRNDARRLRDLAVDGAVTSGFAEYWNPLTGVGLGAVPQGWTGLPVVMDGMLAEAT